MRSGFISLIGRPNVGKSTLLNSFLGEKMTIVSNKPQTTRNKINCIITEPEYQMIFIDTPGVHKPHDKLGEYMTNTALSSAAEVDVVVCLVEYGQIGRGDEFIFNKIKHIPHKILAVNKMDTVSKNDLSKQEKLQLCEQYGFDEAVGISALHQKNLGKLMNKIKQMLPEGPKYYPDDMIIDMPERFIVKEFLREKFFEFTSAEIPYALNVEVESMKQRKNILHIDAVVIVDRDSQKGIVIGKGGNLLKKVGKIVRLELEKLFDTKIFLSIFVKVEKNWRSKRSKLKEYGFV